MGRTNRILFFHYKNYCVCVGKSVTLLPSNGRLLCLLGATRSVLSSVRSVVLYRRSTQTIFSLRLRERRRRSAALLSRSANIERPIPPLVEEETPLPSSDKGGLIDTQTGR
jgi:hypothetical protein